tara:strand:- start:59 stop:550 length:492 start_codon:yes stop_codon:yes gene_type:complete
MFINLEDNIEVRSGLIEGVDVTPLKTFPDERGCIYHGVKASQLSFNIAEVYFKKLYPNVINGWHVHETMTLSFITVVGVTKLVLVDLRRDSSTSRNLTEIYCGEGNHCRVQIPAGIANASQCVGGDFSLFANTPDQEHDPNLQYIRLDPLNGPIKYQWFNKHY